MAEDKKKEQVDDKKLLEQANKVYNSAQAIAQQWWPLLEACYFFAIPSRNGFYRTKETQGEQRNKRLYDTTSIEATKTFVSKLHNAMTPPQIQWGFLEVSDEWNEEPDDVKAEAQFILDKYMRRLFEFIHLSNFDVIINESYFDLAAGTACVVANQGDDENPLLFSSIALNNLAIKESITGRVNTWFRKWENIPINEIQLKWKKAVLTPELELELQQDPDAKANIIKEGVLFRPKESNPYLYIIWHDSGKLLAEPLKSNPGIVWRFQKNNTETWGRGPLMDALPSMASLNEVARLELASANLNVFRPYMAFSDSVFNPHTFKLEPFTVIPVAPITEGSSPPLTPLPESANPNFAQLTIQDLRNQIKSLLFNEAPDTPSIQPGSATEVMAQQQDLAEKIGPLFSRLQQEFLFPIIERCSYILDNMGILPKPKIDGKLIKFVYRSPLALNQGQKEVSRFTQFMQVLQGIVGQETAQLYINPRTAPFKLAEYMQINPDLLQSPQQVDDASQELAEQMQQEQAAQQQPEQTQPQTE